MEDTSAKLLQAAKKILEDNKWIKGTLARNDLGRPVDPEDSDATCFCALGALYRAVHILNFGLEYYHHNAEIYLNSALGGDLTSRSASGYNDRDDTTKEDVLNLYDKAIKLAIEEE